MFRVLSHFSAFFIVVSSVAGFAAANPTIELTDAQSEAMFNALVKSGAPTTGTITSRIRIAEVACGTSANPRGSARYTCATQGPKLDVSVGDHAEAIFNIFKDAGLESQSGPGGLFYEAFEVECVRVHEFNTPTHCTLKPEKRPGNPGGVSAGNS